MINFCKIALVMTISILNILIANGQSVLSASGGNATGKGSVAYTAGQLFYNIYSGNGVSEIQGVQQPFEISVVSRIDNTENIILEYTVYPNPNLGSFVLSIEPYCYRNLRYHLFDYNGTLLQNKAIEGGRTIITIEGLATSIYILEVIADNQKVKVFKIIKN